MPNIAGYWLIYTIGLFVIWGLIVLYLQIKDKKKEFKFLSLIKNDVGEFSLSQLQVVMWTFTLLPLIAAVYFARWVNGTDDPLGAVIPTELLIIMGISAGTVVGSKLIPTKNTKKRKTVINAGQASKGFIYDLIMKKRKDVDEYTLDITRFQQLLITLIVLTFYILTTVTILLDKTTSQITEIPAFHESLVVLIGISHAGYITMKIPDKMNEK